MDSSFNDSKQPQSNQIVPDNNLVWAILATVFCCLPTGIYAIIRSAKVNTLWIQGDYEEAKKAADDAKKWAIYSVIGWAILFVLYLISLAAGIGAFFTGMSGDFN